MCFDGVDAGFSQGCPCGALHTANSLCVGLFDVKSDYCDPYIPRLETSESTEPIEIPDHMNPTIHNKTSRLGYAKPIEFLNLPREVRLLIYGQLLPPTVYSNDVKKLRCDTLGRYIYRNGETRIVPTSLSILLASRLINTEATYFLYRKSDCTFRLYIGAVGMAEKYSMPLSTQRTFSIVQKMEIDIDIDTYAQLSSITATKWRAQLENFSSGSRESCRITLRGTSCFSLLPKGLARLLKLLCGFQTVELVLGKDREVRGLGQLKTLPRHSKGFMGVARLEGNGLERREWID